MKTRFLLASSLTLLACSGGDISNLDGAALEDAATTLPDGAVSSPDGAQQPDVAGPVTCGGAPCGPNQMCVNDTSCACKPGFVPSMNGCDPAPAGSPASHSEADVCQKWKDAHVVTAPNPFAKGGNMCDPGTLSAGGIADTVKRVNLFRWMEGLADATDNAQRNAGAQACAVIQAWNNPGSLGNPHSPPMNAACWTSTGASWAGQSNLAWGTSSPDSVDLYMKDPGASNANSLGHRRWVLHPPLGALGVGYYEGGNNGFGGRGQCLGVFDTSGSGPKPDWYAWPPAGFSPVQVTQTLPNNGGWAWSFHLKKKGVIGSSTIEVRDLGAGKDLSVMKKTLGNGYGDDAVSFYPSGWSPTAGSVYRVTVNVPNTGTYVYEVRPITCN